ncbi:VWA domain-containing protein [Streptomyces sp. NPDC055912]|uniref:VWA domain-containing protein n=1 Tax=Streptomyces sp. NPDC055912 TaxID=3345660 RepID=UPI0035D9E184
MLKKFFGSSTPDVPSAPVARPARTSVADLTKKAAYSLQKSGLAGERAAVYLVLDRSGSMRKYYSDGTVQYLAERVLGLSRTLDDDGSVPVTFFSTDVDGTTVVSVDNYEGRIEEVHRGLDHMGRTNYATAIRAVMAHHRASGATAPALVVFQTDGNPDDRAETLELMHQAVDQHMFWLFVSFGKKVDFLQTLDHLGLPVDHIGLFRADDPHRIGDEDLYDGITSQFVQWLRA